MISGGWSYIAYDDDNAAITRTNDVVRDRNIGSARATYDNKDNAALGVTYFWTDNFATSLDVGMPTQFRLTSASRFIDGNTVPDIGSAKQKWRSTFLGKWFFGDAKSTFRPFIGAGLMYASYGDVELSQRFQDDVNNVFVAAPGTGQAKGRISSSWTPVANAGAIYNFNKNWSLGLSVSYIPLKTEIEVTANPNIGGFGNGPETAHITSAISPWTTFLSVGYTF